MTAAMLLLRWFPPEHMAPHAGRSFAEMGLALAALAFFTFRFAHAQCAAANLKVLDDLRSDGLLCGNPRKDFRRLSRLIRQMSPALAMRTERWVRAYATALWITRRAAFLAPGPRQRDRLLGWSHHEMRRLAAHQAERYQIAVGRLAALRS